MWPYYPELLATPVPRYTSYPTAAEFVPLRREPVIDALSRAHGDISLYVHIPFCEQICFYCGCNTARAGKRARLEAYLDALHREIALVGGLLPRSGARVTRIAFGGGSPNAIAPVDFIRLVDALTAHFPLAEPEWSVELDPRTMSADWAAALRGVGLTRASLGVQTLAAHCQQAIGRIQPEPLIARTTGWLREAGVTSLNFDLMYGLPRQSAADLADTLERSIALGADRVALFGYAHVPHIVPRQKAVATEAMPDQRQRFAMAALGHAQLTAAGYVPVGFDHFALAHDPLAQAAMRGRLQRNFQGFTDDQATTLIGLGASSISQFPGLLAQTEKNSGRYRMLLSQGLLPAERGIVRPPAEQARAALIANLLCRGEATLPVGELAEKPAALAPFIERGLAALNGSRLAITPDGLPYARTIAALFDPHRAQSDRRFSSAV